MRYQDFEVIYKPGEKTPTFIPVTSEFRVESFKETTQGSAVKATEWRGTAEPVPDMSAYRKERARATFDRLSRDEKLSLLREWEAELMAERIFQDPLAEDTHG